jgi:hypothetical protein
MGTAANPELCLPKATAEVVARAVQCLPRPALLASMQEEEQGQQQEGEGVGRPLGPAQWHLPTCGRPTPTQAAAEEEEQVVIVTTTKVVRLPLWAWPLCRRARRRSGSWRPLLQSRQEGVMLLQKRRHKVVAAAMVVVVCTEKAAGTSCSVEEAEEAEGDISSNNNSKE